MAYDRAVIGALVLVSFQKPSVADEMERIRAHYGLPSICAGAIVDGKVVSLDAVGVRRVGSEDRATVDDRYHIGSNTKAFTATLTAILVQKGKLAWNTPLERLFPKLSTTMAPAYRTVTPLQLVQHRSGLTGETYSKGMAYFASKESLPAQRADYARRALSLTPSSPPGTKYEYSNRGYIVLGAALEGLTRRSWEDLVTTEILRPLGLNSAGFGAADAGGKPQPVGHVERDGKLVPISGGDNLPMLGPAGTLNMSVRDMLRWCAFQADEGRYGGPLTPASFAVLHTPPAGGDYAGGFVAIPRAWAGGNALYHLGSNTMNVQSLWIAPARRFAVVASTNAETKDAAQALDEVCGLLIGRFCPK